MVSGSLDQVSAANKVAGKMRLSLFFFFLLAAAFIPTWPFLLLDADREGGFIKVHHLIALTLVGVLFDKNGPAMSRSLVVFFGVSFATILITGLIGGFYTNFLVNYFYCAFCAVVGTQLYSRLGHQEFMQALRIGGRMFAAGLVIEMILNARQFIDAFSGTIPHPDSFLNPGGVNIEGAYLVIITALELGTPYFWPIGIFGIAFGAASASRSAELGALMVIGWGFWLSLTGRQRIMAIVAGASVLGIVTPIVLLNYSDVNIIARFVQVGSVQDVAVFERLLMWYGAFQAFLANPFGHGPGAAAQIVAQTSPEWLGDTNIHNIYLQFAVDLGLQGILTYLFVAFVSIRKFVLYGRGRYALGFAFLAYLILAIQEFRGYDQIIFLFLGALTIAKPSEIQASINFTASRQPNIA